MVDGEYVMKGKALGGEGVEYHAEFGVYLGLCGSGL